MLSGLWSETVSVFFFPPPCILPPGELAVGFLARTKLPPASHCISFPYRPLLRTYLGHPHHNLRTVGLSFLFLFPFL